MAKTSKVDRKTAGSDLNALVARCDRGDEKALAELREKLWQAPELTKVYDLVHNTERRWMEKCFGDQHTVKEFMATELRKMRRELAGPDPTPLERLLADRIALCWLQLQYADCMYAENMGGCSLETGDYLQRRQDRAHRRFLSAVKTLAQVRKLGVPAIQLNVADKQVNVLGASSRDESDEPDE